MKKIVVLLTICLLIACTVISVTAQAVAPVAAATYNDLDYRHNDRFTTIRMGDVLTALDGIAVSDTEKEYIRVTAEGNGLQAVLYYTKPDLPDYEYDYDGVNSRLIVTVQQDSYVPKEHPDKTVDWIPTTCTIGDRVAEFAPATELGKESYHRAVFEDFDWTAEAMTAMVDYRAEFEISAETLNKYINYAYKQSLLLHDEYETLPIKQAAYKEALDAYEQWIEYEKDLERYQQYLNEAAMFRDYLVYQEYLAELAEYEAYLENKAEWDKYYADLAKYAKYLADKNQYEKEDMPLVQAQLELLALMEKEDPKTGYSFIETMIDDRIGSLINDRKYRLLLVHYCKVSQGTIDEAKDSSEWLKRFCETYQSLETEQEKYEFFIKEYNRVEYVTGVEKDDGLVKHLNQLYEAILDIYENDAVYEKLVESRPHHVDTLERMLGMLYVQRCVFNDKATMNVNEVVVKRGNKTVSQLVDASLLPATDTNKATPLAAWPTAPEVQDEPRDEPSEKLPYVEAPDDDMLNFETPGITNPKEQLPDNMEDPGYMEQPEPPAEQEPAHPGVEPKLNWKDHQTALHEAYLAGQIVLRPAFTEDQSLVLTASNQFSVQLVDDERCYFMYFYDEDDKYLGQSLGVPSGQPVRVPAEIGTPEKPATAQYSYEFAGWVDEEGEPIDMSSLTKDTYAYASFTEVVRQYNVTWNVDGFTTTQQWAYGEEPWFEATDILPDAQYEYRFIGWDKQIVPVTGDVTYTAQYERIVRRYSVVFRMDDGSELLRGEYRYDKALSEVMLSKPFKTPCAEYTYTFAGWVDENGHIYASNADLPALTSNMTLTAKFESTRNSYTVTWVVDGVSTQSTWEYGQTPTFGEQNPQKASDEHCHYTFTGWDAEIVAVTGDATYTAEFSSTVRLYRVEFIVEGQSHVMELEYGVLPDFGDTPQKASDLQYDYEFFRWDRNPSPVKEDVTYVAQFREIARKYPVTFIVEGVETVVEVEYGSAPRYSGTPEKPDDGIYYYVFTGWDKEIAAVDGSEAVYTACFEAVPLVPVGDGDEVGQLIAGENGVFELIIPGSSADLSQLFERLGEKQAEQLEVKFGQAVLVFPKEQIESFYLMGGGISKVTLVLTELNGQVAYKLEILDASGEPLTYLVCELTVKLPYSSTHKLEVYRADASGNLTQVDAAYQNGYLVLEVMESATFVIKEKYAITKNPTANGVFDVVGEAYEGDVIIITPDPNEGYLIDQVTIEVNGQRITVEPKDGAYTFVMPKGDVKVSTTFKVVEGGTVPEVLVGVITALLIVAVGLVIAVILIRRKSVKA